jgi:hypothetical protein
MAKKRQTNTTTAASNQPLTPASKSNKPPPPSKKPEEDKVEEIDDDEEVISVNTSSSEGEEDDDDDAEDDAKSKKDEDNDEEETDSSDSDDETVPPPKIKSINSKSSASTARSGTKRSADDDTKHSADDNTKQSKKKKTISAADDEKKKEKEVDNKKSGDDSKKLFQRVFTEDDELTILKGLVDFKEEKGTDPLKYPADFYEEVKKSISFAVTLDQLKDKMRRLKTKFENKMKICKNGKIPTFSKPVEEEMFEYSKKIWGDTDENGKAAEKQVAAKKPPTMKKLVMETDFQVGSSSDGKENPGSSYIMTEMHRFDKSVSGVFGVSIGLLKSELELIEESKRVEIEKKWKELRVAELKCVAMRAKLSEDLAKLILEAVQSSSSDD